jgi:hypothetical protein
MYKYPIDINEFISDKKYNISCYYYKLFILVNDYAILAANCSTLAILTRHNSQRVVGDNDLVRTNGFYFSVTFQREALHEDFRPATSRCPPAYPSRDLAI